MLDSAFRRAAGKMNSQQKLGLVRRKRWLQSSCNLRWCTHLVTVTNFSESRNLQKLQFRLNVQAKNAHLSPVFFSQKINPSEEFPTLVKSYLLVSSRWTVYFARVKLNLVKLGIDPLLPESSLYSRTAQLIQQDSNSTWGKGQVKMQLYASFSRHSIQIM